MTATVAVTGARGLLGRALAIALAAAGHRVRALLRNPGGSDPSGALVRLQQHGVEIVAGDVTDAPAVQRAMAGCSHVVHLAAATSGVRRTLAQYREVNVQGTRNVTDAARQAGVQRLVYASTLGVYGFVNGDVLDERSPVRPNTVYRRTKLEGERVLQEAPDGSPMETVVVRLTSAVGASANRWNPMMRAIASGGFRLIGDGANHIDLLPVDDIVRGIAQSLLVPGIGGRLYVLGATQPTTVRAFTGMIARALGVPAPTAGPPRWPYAVALRYAHLLARTDTALGQFLHNREVLVADKRSSSARARTDLGFAPSGQVEAAIRGMGEAFRARG